MRGSALMERGPADKVVDHFYEICNEHDWVIAETLTRAVEALRAGKGIVISGQPPRTSRIVRIHVLHLYAPGTLRTRLG